MIKYKKSMLLLMSATAATGFSFNAHAANWRVIPTIELTEIYTDNVNLDSSFSQSDFVTNISPRIDITGNGNRLATSLNYSPNYFFYPGSDDQHDLRHNLRASLNGELIEDAFFIESSANISQQFLDRRQAISSESASRTDNRRTIQTYSISPYMSQRLGSWAVAELRYDFNYIRQSGDPQQTTVDTVFGDSQRHNGTFKVSSGRQFTQLNWTILTAYTEEQRQNTSNYETTTAQADLSFQLTRKLTLLGRAGYEKRKGSTGSIANFNGFIWDAGISLVPGPRTTLSFRYGNRYDGNTFSLDASYKITAKSGINLSYTDRIQTFQSFVFEDNNDVITDLSLNNDFISGDLNRRKEWRLSLSGIRGRTSYNAILFNFKNRSDNAVFDEKRYGATISIDRKLNQRLNINGSFTYNLSQFASDNTDDKFWSTSFKMNYQISKSLEGFLEYTHTDRDQVRFNSLNGGSNYVSLTIRAKI